MAHFVSDSLLQDIRKRADFFGELAARAKNPLEIARYRDTQREIDMILNAITTDTDYLDFDLMPDC